MLHWRAVGFYLIAPLLALAVVIGVHFKTDLSAFFIAGGNAEEILLASELQSGTLSRRYLIAIGSGGQQNPPHGLFIQTLKKQLQAIDGVSKVWLPDQPMEMADVMLDIYEPYAAAWYSLNPERDLPALFSEAGLRQRAEWLKNALLSPQGQNLKKRVLHDPLLLTLNGFKALATRMQPTVHAGAYRNLILETGVAGLDVPRQQRIQNGIKHVFDKLNQPSDSHYSLAMTGIPVFAVATQRLIQGDIQRVSLLSVAALLVLFLLMFHDWNALLQVFSILVIAILTAILATQLAFGYVHGMTVAIGATLVGICIDYPIHALVHAQAAEPRQRRHAIRRIWPSMILGGGTTLIGYCALGASGYPGFQQIAVFAGTGIITSLLLTRFVFPLLLSKPGGKPLALPLIGAWACFCQRRRPWLIGVLTLTLAASAWNLDALHGLQDMQELTPELDYLKQNDQRIRQRMTSIEPGRFVLVSAPDIEHALEKSERVARVLEGLKQTSALDDYYGLYPWLLSARQQQINQNQLQTYLTPENLQRWRSALAAQGLSVAKLGQLNYPGVPPLTPAQILATPVNNILDNQIIQNDRRTLIMMWLARHQPNRVKTAIAGLKDVQYFSQRDLLKNMMKNYTDRAIGLLATGLIAIIALLTLRYKNLFKALQTLAPALIAGGLILGFWAFTGVAVSFLHLVGFLLAVSICVDYGIFYQENRGRDSRLTYQAIAASMLTSVLAFACLLVSESSVLKILAGVVVLGVLLGFLLCPIFISLGRNKIRPITTHS